MLYHLDHLLCHEAFGSREYLPPPVPRSSRPLTYNQQEYMWQKKLGLLRTSSFNKWWKYPVKDDYPKDIDRFSIYCLISVLRWLNSSSRASITSIMGIRFTRRMQSSGSRG